jgi:hypothetical protein
VDAQEILAMADERFERRLTEESAAIRQEIATLRSEMATRAETQALREDVNAIRQTMATRAETEAIRQEMTALRQEMTAGFSRLERQIAESRVDIIKWSFLFWTGQCFVIIGSLLVFLRAR